MYKIFDVIYSHGRWHSGDLPHFYYIAKSKEDVIANSKKYQEFLKQKESYGGSVWIYEIHCVVNTGERYGLVSRFEFENLEDFNIEMSINKTN